MKKFYCDVWKEEIDKIQCYLKRDFEKYCNDPHCRKCPKYQHIVYYKTVSPDRLKAFVKKDFQLTLTSERELREDRRKKKRKSKRNDRNEYMKAMRRGQVRERKKNEPTCIRDSVIKEAGKTYFNLCVYRLNYFLNSAIENGNIKIINSLNIHNEAQVHEYISSFITAQGYKKHDGMNYSSNDIKGIIERVDIKEDSTSDKELKKTLREWFESFSDWELEDFCNSLVKKSPS